MTNDTLTDSNNYPLGLPGLVTLAANTTAALTDKTTYYVMANTGTSFKVAATSTGAVAGSAVDITTMTQAGGGTVTFTPITTSGTFTLIPYCSNDGVNFSPIQLSTGGAAPGITSATPYTPGSTIWNIGKNYFRYIRLVYTNATWGSMLLNYSMNAQKGSN